jgi:muramoyltetrapeptide carboxypeptidase
MPDLTDKIIFIEDCGEALYRIDRALTQLRLAGFFKAPAAVVCGNFSNPRPGEAGMFPAFFKDFFAADDFPVVLNFRYGHCPRSFILPQGVRMQFTCQNREIALVESAVEKHGG